MAKKLADLKSKQLEKTEEGEPEGEGREGWLRWVLGWVVGPGLLVAAIVGFGAHVGANHADGWFARFVVWLFG